MMNKLKRAAVAAVSGAAAFGALGLVASPAHAFGLRVGPATVVTQGTNTPLASGGSATNFSLSLGNGASCTGDSTTGGYRVQSYMVSSAVDPSNLTFGATGPTAVSGQFVAPLYDTTGSPYINKTTQNAVAPSTRGQITQPIPAFNFAVYGPGNIPAGTYNVGIACTVGAPSSGTQMHEYWNASMTFTTAPSDSPAQVTWVFNVPGFTPLAAPARLMDTRNSPTIDGQFTNTGPLAAGSTTQLQVGGRAGISATAPAATLNVTVTNPTSNGWVTVWPCGQTQPNASNLNYSPGQTIPNQVITSIGTGGKVCIYTQAATDLIVDASGTLSSAAFTPLAAPARLMDTRNSPTIDGQFTNTGPLAAGSTTQLLVGTRAGIPAGASSATLNVTVTNPRGNGWVTVWPCGQTQPNASNLNYSPGQTIPNAVVTSIGSGGKVCIYTQAATDLIVDASGTLATSSFTALAAPARLMDTRNSPTIDGVATNTGPLGAGSTTYLQVGGRAGISASAPAATLNVTVTSPTGNGWVTVWPCGQTQPNASNLNYSPGQTIPNAVITSIGSGGKVCIYTQAATDLIVDASGTIF